MSSEISGLRSRVGHLEGKVSSVEHELKILQDEYKKMSRELQKSNKLLENLTKETGVVIEEIHRQTEIQKNIEKINTQVEVDESKRVLDAEFQSLKDFEIELAQSKKDILLDYAKGIKDSIKQYANMINNELTRFGKLFILNHKIQELSRNIDPINDDMEILDQAETTFALRRNSIISQFTIAQNQVDEFIGDRMHLEKKISDVYSNMKEFHTLADSLEEGDTVILNLPTYVIGINERPIFKNNSNHIEFNPINSTNVDEIQISPFLEYGKNNFLDEVNEISDLSPITETVSGIKDILNIQEIDSFIMGNDTLKELKKKNLKQRIKQLERDKYYKIAIDRSNF